MKRGLIIILFSLFAAPLIKAQPKALFSASPNKGCSPASIKFINQSTGSGLTYFWDLGNGNTSTLAEPKAIYYTPGFYTIKLKVTDKSGKIDSVTKSKYIEIFRNPKADFGAKVVKGCVPFDPGLTDKSTRGSGMINKWTWDYGDGKVSTGSSPVYSYTNQGVYKISLLIEDANGCKDSLSKSNYITASETPQILFMADKTYSCTKPLSVNFTNKSTGLASGDQFEWEFGDGTKSTDKNPKKTYNDTGSFSVTLKIKPVNGCNTSIEVKNYLTIWKPKVSFKIYPTPVCVGEDINFVSTTKPTHINFINKWDFGDGTFGGKNWTTHAYQKDGTYNVKLIVSMPDGTCKDSLIMNKVASIIPRPVANFIVKDTLLCLPGLKDTLIDITKGATIRYWYLNDEFISSKNAVITKVYNPGYNKVKLISGNGYCFDSIVNEKAIYVDSIDLNYFIAPRGGCVPLHVNFTDSTRSKLSISSWLWDLGDGNLQVAQTFDYTYYKEGMYIIELTVTTEKGCKNSTKDTIYATNKPIAEFHFPETVKCNSEIMEMIEAKSGKVPINQYKWYIDNELVSDKKQLSNILKRKPGKYDIKLVVGNKGCSDTAVLSDILKIEPPYISFDFIGTKCTGYPYYFINTSIEADTFCWKLNNQKKVCNKDTLIIKDSTDGWPIALWGKNFTSGCEDEAINLEVPEYRYIGFGATVGNCTPTNLIVQNFSQNFTSYKWNWGDGRKEDNSSKGIVRLYEKPGTYEVKLYASDKEGCIDSTKYKFSITGPHPDFEVFPKEGCGPHTVTLVNKTPSNNIKDQYWHISGVPPIAAIKDTTFYIFKKPGPLDGGAYAINLKATDNNGCINVKSDTVKVGGIAFDFEILEAVTKCRYPKITIQPIFKQQLDKKNLNYFWDVGDGRKFTGSIVDYFYDGPSLYTVSLKVVDENGCISQLDTVVKINEKDLKANFKADKLDANCPPLMVNFNSLSTPNNISKYEWDFGDGSYSKIANPTHIYLKSGKFTVKLKVWVGGCSDEIVYKDLVLINGPKGSFDFDKKEGCTPLEVNFTSTLYNTKKMEWDMGDGVILEDSTMPTYVYTRVGKYTPLMILADSFGCKYTLPPVGTIEVFPLPVPDFTNKNACPNTPVSFSNLSKPIKGTIKKSLWDFGDGDTVSLFEPSHIFKTYGTFNVKLNVWNSDGCEAEIVKQVVIKNIEAGFKPKKDFYCTGQIPSFINTSKSDTTFRLYHWFLNGELISKNINPVLPKLASGLYKVTLMVEDNNGCTDTFNKMNGLLIGDTFAPKPPFIYRVSVENDNSVALDFSGYRSFDFKHYTIYKSNNSKIATVNNLNDTSKIIGSLNTLHNVYCYKVTATNICGLESDIKLALEHCTVETKATGELKQVNVKWNAYKGWPVKMYEIFREDIAAKGKYDYLATVSGNQLNYTDTSVYCKMQHFYKIKAFENGGFNKMSWSDTTAARPKFENSVPPNNTIRATVDFDKEITIEWAGSGYPKIPIVKYILEKSEDGVHYKWYQSFRPDEFAYTDKKVLVDDKSYFYRTYAVDTCELRSPVTNFAKTILLKADTNVQERPFVTWSSYQGWTEGVIEYEVQCKQWDGTFVTIGFTSGHDSLFVDNLTDLNGYPYYCYRVIGYKNMINGKRQVFSISNEDCAPVRSRIFAANAFTINGDNINETFDIKGLYIRDYNIKIFTRWGELIFESNDMNVDWDGYYNGQLCQMDAYIWIIKAIGVDDVNWPLKGTVTIVR